MHYLVIIILDMIVSAKMQQTMDGEDRHFLFKRSSVFFGLGKSYIGSNNGIAQFKFFNVIQNLILEWNTVTFGIGPTGTGKTYLAMAMAVAAFNNKQVSRIILTRPVVEAGENLGFLPGSLTEKIDPYIRPLYDALFEMMEPGRANKYLADGTIEIAPLAFMRGRTLNDAFIVLDEAQNTTPGQMKMFLTRLGIGSKMVITGDITQADLPKGISGLKTVRQVLDGLEDIAFCEFKNADVVRHSLVARIVAAYARAEEMNLRL